MIDTITPNGGLAKLQSKRVTVESLFFGFTGG
ncbi:hypothetical protein N478_18305 [Pseudoalteromonas luteoviolacea S4060-1]|uniref:Uncharacterized protein n=1 Tax=Pseudoalteromonas luteoviolacea S4060-1 TaxID=1365257 RepID=A0A167MQK3_9GAMM|nr:hypothetical protein N478_18305 [Pseudoalteromonas luteoviolacea S4060-1]